MTEMVSDLEEKVTETADIVSAPLLVAEEETPKKIDFTASLLQYEANMQNIWNRIKQRETRFDLTDALAVSGYLNEFALLFVERKQFVAVAKEFHYKCVAIDYSKEVYQSQIDTAWALRVALYPELDLAYESTKMNKRHIFEQLIMQGPYEKENLTPGEKTWLFDAFVTLAKRKDHELYSDDHILLMCFEQLRYKQSVDHRNIFEEHARAMDEKLKAGWDEVSKEAGWL